MAGTVQAQNRTIQDWFTLVENGSLRLPRFQRHEAWDRATVVSLLETVVRGLPAGAALVLNVGTDEPFISRHLVTAPEVDGHVNEHLLDGQQRLTALWRSLNGTYDDLDLFLSWKEIDEDKQPTIEVVSQPRWTREGVKYPRWCDSPRHVFERGLIPVVLVAPNAFAHASEWLQKALDDHSEVVKWLNRLGEVRQQVASYNIPYLALPETTPRDVALDVFVKMNTSNIRLTAFDIVVAQVEAAAGASMHELLEGVKAEAPMAEAYGDVGETILDTACLREGRTASKANYLRLDFETLPGRWQSIADPLNQAFRILGDEGMYDEARLPNSPVLPVIAALAHELPRLDALGNARKLLSFYLWRAAFTRRYESASATRAHQDYVALRTAIRDNLPLANVAAPIFDENVYPLPNEETLLRARWPKTRDSLGRGILALSLAEGGKDIADGVPASRESVKDREYHHLFPDSTLVKLGALEPSESYRALNCALVTWRTNRHVSNRSPLEYLAERIANTHLGEDEVRQRLASHLVPWTELVSSGPYGHTNDAARVKSDYESFLAARAVLVRDRAAERAGEGLIGTSVFRTPNRDEY